MKLIVNEINRVCVDSVKKTITNCYLNLKNVSSFSERYSEAVNTLKRTLKGLCLTLTNEFMKIGQYLLLRDMICLSIRMLAKVGSNRLYLVLENINNTLLNDISNRSQNKAENEEQIMHENMLMSVLNPFFAHTGMLEPTKKIFMTCKEI